MFSLTFLLQVLWRADLHVPSPATWLILAGKELIRLTSMGLIYFGRFYKFSIAGQRLAHLGTGNGVSELSVNYQNPTRSWGSWGLSAWADFQSSAGCPCYAQLLYMQFSSSRECRLALHPGWRQPALFMWRTTKVCWQGRGMGWTFTVAAVGPPKSSSKPLRGQSMRLQNSSGVLGHSYFGY